MNFFSNHSWEVILQRNLYSNSLGTWLTALMTALFTLLFLNLVLRYVVKRLTAVAKRTDNHLDDLAGLLLKKTTFVFLLVLSLYSGSLALELNAAGKMLVSRVTMMIVFIQAGIWIDTTIRFYTGHYLKIHKEKANTNKTSTVLAMGFIGRVLVWTLLFMLSLSALGINITALVAGLGIGGIAVALAVQNILSDLFASLSIMLDEPFAVGDFIVIDQFAGTVEHIGLKTTRLRSLDGEQVIISNNDLLASRIRNYTSLRERRVLFHLHVPYTTEHEKLSRIPEIIREVIEAQQLTRFDRAHFTHYTEYSLKYEVAYYVLSTSYNQYLDIHQQINLAIFRRFRDEGIQFAHPTRTILIHPPSEVRPLDELSEERN